MRARSLGLLALGMAFCAIGLQAMAQGQNPANDSKAQDKKFEVPKDALAGKIKAVDLTANTFTVRFKNNRDRTFKVDDKTEFWGPKGGDRGTGPKGLKDDCMEPGYEIKVEPAKDGKFARNVYLPYRKSEEDGKKSKS